MQWSNYVATTEYRYGAATGNARSFMVRAVSLKHALNIIQRKYPEAHSHEVQKCRCSETNNDICQACYRIY